MAGERKEHKYHHLVKKINLKYVKEKRFLILNDF